MSDADMQTRGLIAYTDNNHLYHKVHSVFPQVESRDGNLYSEEFPQYEIAGDLVNSIGKVYDYLNGKGGYERLIHNN